MSEPKHIFVEPSEYLKDLTADSDNPEFVRYTLTSGPEWDALMHEVRVQRERCRPDGSESTFVRILAYFEEPRDE